MTNPVLTVTSPNLTGWDLELVDGDQHAKLTITLSQLDILTVINNGDVMVSKIASEIDDLTYSAIYGRLLALTRKRLVERTGTRNQVTGQEEWRYKLSPRGRLVLDTMLDYLFKGGTA